MVSLDWKWLFIYPDQRIATVNTLTVPVGAPLHFAADLGSVMNAFFIPQLGSMIYTMNGMTTRLDLRADKAGTYQGLSAHFSGDGFPDMMFDVHVVSQTDFTDWASKTAQQRSGARTPTATRNWPSSRCRRTSRAYRLDDPDLFQGIATQQIAAGAGTAN